jgi:hypothetical protein
MPIFCRIIRGQGVGGVFDLRIVRGCGGTVLDFRSNFVETVWSHCG